MAKIIRYDGDVKPFGVNATGTERTVFGSPSAAPVQSDTLDANINADYLLGWEKIAPGAKPPKQYFNGALFTATQLNAYLHQMGIAEWNDKQEFQIDSISNRNGVLYKCKTVDHTSVTPPESDAVNWEVFVDPAQVSAEIALASIAGQYMTYGGTADAITLTSVNKVADVAYIVGAQYRFRATATNTGIATVNIDGLGIKTLKTITSVDLPAGYIRTDADTIVTYDGVNFVLNDQGDLYSIGINQTWQDVSASRVIGVTYTNTTGKPISVAVNLVSTTNIRNSELYLYLDSVLLARSTCTQNGQVLTRAFGTMIVLDGQTYRIDGNDSIDNWWELR